MSRDPILLLGGSGVIGRQTAHYLRDNHPGVPLLIGGRDREKAAGIARDLGNAEGVALDLAADDLGIGDRAVSAVAVFVKDDALAGLRFARARNVPHVSISSGVQELGPEVAAYMYAPGLAPIVLGTEWLVGATSLPALSIAERFGRIDSIAIGALVDEQDTIGPAADYDLERLGETLPAALTRTDGAWTWRVGDAAQTRFCAIDGTEMTATAFAANDVLALATATGAANVRFDLANGVTSSRRRGAPASTEIVIAMRGENRDGQPLATRHAVMHPAGQVPLTALGVTLVLERLLGIDGAPPTPPGLYFPCQLLDPGTYLERMRGIGGELLDLEVL